MTTPDEPDQVPPDDIDPDDQPPGGPDNPDDSTGDDTEDPSPGLAPPYDLRIVNAPEGGWTVIVQWEYSIRYPEIASFSVSRLKHGTTEWEVVAEDLRNSVRTHRDMLPDESPYTYSVTAHPADGSAPLLSDPPTDEAGQVIYIQADSGSTKPRNIRKPLRSTTQKMFIAWDYHAAASSYVLEAIGEDGNPYMTVNITDVYAPYGLFVGPHPTSMAKVRVTIMRRRSDGTEYPASFAESSFFVDDLGDPHFAVIDIEGQPSVNRRSRSLAYSVVVALAEYGTEISQLTVNGVIYYDVWIDHDGHKSATIETCYPAGSAVTAAMRIASPDNLQEESGS